MKHLHELKNKEFIFTCLNTLKDTNKLTPEVLSLLTDPDRCFDIFNCKSRLAILMEIPTNISESALKDLCYFGNHRRYYPDRFTVGNRTFVVTNHWYGPNRSNPDNRTPFMNWFISLNNQ